MTNMELKLYEIAPEISALLLADEFDEEALTALTDTFEAKADAIIKLSDHLEGFAAMCKAEEKRIADRRKAAEARQTRILAYLKQCMEMAEMAELPLGTKTAKLQANPPKLVIDNPDEVDDRYIQTTIVRSIDNAALKAAAMAGPVTVAHIERGTHLRIR